MFDKQLKVLGWLILADAVVASIIRSSDSYPEVTYEDLFEDVPSNKLSKIVSPPDIKKVNTSDKAVEWLTDKVGEDVVLQMLDSEVVTDLLEESPTNFEDVMDLFFDAFQLEDREDLILIYGDDLKVDDLLDYAKEHKIR